MLEFYVPLSLPRPQCLVAIHGARPPRCPVHGSVDTRFQIDLKPESLASRKILTKINKVSSLGDLRGFCPGLPGRKWRLHPVKECVPKYLYLCPEAEGG